MKDTSLPYRLQRLAFTEDLSLPQLEQMAEDATPVQWDAGVTVFREGDLDTKLYVVEEGQVAIEMLMPGRGLVTILTVGPGEMFGWSSLFYQRPKTASARTIKPTKAIALDAEKLRSQCESDPKLGFALTRRLLQIVSERLKATRMQLIDVYSHPDKLTTPAPAAAKAPAKKPSGGKSTKSGK